MANGQPIIPEGMIDEPTEEDKAILLEIQQEEAQEAEKQKEETPAPPEEKSDTTDGGEDKSEEKTAKEEDTVDDSDDDSDVVEDDEDLDKKEVEERKPKFVRLEKHLKMRDKVKDLEAQIKELKDSKADTPEAKKEAEEALAKEVEDVANELGLSKEATQKLLKTAEDGAYNRLKAELGDKLDAIESVSEKSKAEAEIAKQENLWQKQLNELKEKFPDEAEHIQSVRGSLKKLAFSDQYSRTPLDVIYKGVEGLRDLGRKTVEGGRGGSTKGKVDNTTEFDRIIKENDQSAITEMDAETFKEFQQYIDKNNL